MTEQGWMESKDPYLLLREPVCRESERKRRLYGCACLRRVKIFHPEIERERVIDLNGFIETAEQYADYQIGATRLHAACEVARQRVRDWHERCFGWEQLHHLWSAVHEVLSPKKVLDVSVATYHVIEVAAFSAMLKGTTPDSQVQLEDAERRKQEGFEAEVIRHVFGNPFRHNPAPVAWSGTARQLAHAFYNGEDCGFALQDALLEAGHPELADHFREEQLHPKGCWVLDLVLGRA